MEWIDVGEALPNDGDVVLVYTNETNWMIGLPKAMLVWITSIAATILIALAVDWVTE